MKKERILSYDILKTIAIFFVVMQHNNLYNNTMAEAIICHPFIYIAVPIFFMVNGALMLGGDFSLKKHIKKTLILIAVVTAWRGIYLGLAAAGGSIHADITVKEYLEYFIFEALKIGNCSAAHLWFIKELIPIYVVFPLLYYAFHQGKEGKTFLKILTVFLFIVTFFMTEIKAGTDIIAYFSGKPISDVTILKKYQPFTSPEYLVYFILGGLIGNDFPEALEKRPKLTKILSACGVVIGMAAITGMRYLYFGDITNFVNALPSAYRRVAVLLTAVSLFVLLRGIKTSKKIISAPFNFIGSFTLGIYYLHWPLSFIAAPIMVDAGLTGIGWNLVRTAAIMAVSLGISYALSKIPVVRRLVK